MSVQKNYIYNLVYQILVLLIPLITTPYISRILGATGIGAYSYTTAIVSYFVLFANLGSNYYGSREIAYVRDDILERSKVFWEVIIFRFVTTMCSIVVYFFLIRNSEYRLILSVQSIMIVAVFFDITWFFSGLEEFGETVLRNVIVKLASVIYIFTFVKSADDLALYILGIVLATLLGNMSFWISIPKYISKVPINNLKPLRNWKLILQLFVPYIATQVYTALDKIMIGYFSVGTNENGYYEQAEKIVKILLTIITTLGTVMVPRFAYLFKKQEWKEINSYLKKGFSFVWLIGIPMCLGIIVIADLFVPWFFGAGYNDVVPLMRVFSILILSIGLSNLLGTQYLIPTGRQNLYTITVVVAALINFILNFILVPKYFAMGATIASVVAETIIMILQVFILRKEVSLTIIFGTSRNYLMAGILMLLGCCLLRKIVPYTIFGMLVIVGVGAIIYCIMLITLKDEFVMNYINLFVKKVNKLSRKGRENE